MTATFYVGDAIEVMGKLPAKSVDLVISSPPFLALRSYLPQDHPDKALEGGSQSTPGEYVDWLLDVVEACARILAPHGSLCFELGDTYSGSGESGWERDKGDYRRENRSEASANGLLEQRRITSGWPLAKSLSLIPETFRWAMVYGHNPHTGRRTDPWRLRNVIRWVRPNPPVGALGDKFRPATSELMVFCKAKDRYFDLDAVRDASPYAGEKASTINGMRTEQTFDTPKQQRDYRTRYEAPASAPPLDWWCIPPGGYPGAHYAVWPPELLIKPIKAMCPESVCRVCGEPRRRLSSVPQYISDKTGVPVEKRSWLPGERQAQGAIGIDTGVQRVTETLGFSDCGHDDYRPGTVLDPFAGSGTTLAVATGHGRDAIGIDLDERNYDLALDRVGPLILQRGTID